MIEMVDVGTCATPVDLRFVIHVSIVTKAVIPQVASSVVVANRDSYNKMTCNNCLTYFSLYRCNRPDECDRPKCQGLCNCEDEDRDVDEPTKSPDQETADG